jgi:AAA+ superfamily predicted ATPase
MFPEFSFYLDCITRLIYVVTDEEDRFLTQLRDGLRRDNRVANARVYNAAFGLIPLLDLIEDWTKKEHKIDKDTLNIQDALTAIYKDEASPQRKYYVITDPDRWLQDQHVQRRILNILHQVHNDSGTAKILICVGSRRYIPEKLARYTEVVHDTGFTADEILKLVCETCAELEVPAPDHPEEMFRGLTSFEVQSALIQGYKRDKLQDDKELARYKFRQLRKTDLVQYVDTSKNSFAEVGGAGRFKKWAEMTKAAWTPEGRAFGLEPPKGVLAVGIWGTGKSLTIKALGSAWGLPVIQLELGKLRTSELGGTEGNMYRALRIIESMSPCLVWVDEAEKSLAGSHSSSHTDAGTTSRSIGIFSTWLQETKLPVCLAMTANSLKTLPVEFVNRMDDRWFFDLPSIEDRIDILKIHIAKRGQDYKRFDLAALAEKAKLMVGREIEQAIKSALTASFHAKKRALDEGILFSELERKPRIVKTMVAEINETLDWIGFDPDVDDGIRAKFAADPAGRDRKFSVS